MEEDMPINLFQTVNVQLIQGEQNNGFASLILDYLFDLMRWYCGDSWSWDDSLVLSNTIEIERCKCYIHLRGFPKWAF